MINVKLTRAEALLIIELIKKSAQELINTLLIAVEEESDKEQVARAAKQNDVQNLEAEVRRLTDLVNKKPDGKPMEFALKKNGWGLKKDGTPKAKPGRKTIKRTTKGIK